MNQESSKNHLVVLVSKYDRPIPFNELVSNCLKTIKILKIHISRSRLYNLSLMAWLHIGDS